MSCTATFPTIEDSYGPIENPMGDDALNEYLVSYTQIGNELKLEYELPNSIRIENAPGNVELSKGGFILERPGYYQLTAYIKLR